MLKKVFVYSDQQGTKFGPERKRKIREIHGQDTIIEIDKFPPFEGTRKQMLSHYEYLINQKTDAEYVCYLELESQVAQRLIAKVEKGLSFGVIYKAERKKTTREVTIEYYRSTVGEVHKQSVRATTKKLMRESSHYVHAGGKRPVKKRSFSRNK